MNKTDTPKFFRIELHFLGLSTALGTVVATATILGFMGQLHWIMDLFSHFRVLYLAVLIGISIPLLALHYRRAASTLLIFALINLTVILPLYVGGQKTPAEQGHTLRAVLLNVNTQLGDPVRVSKFIKETDPDILVLEEINERWVNDLQWLVEFYPYSCIEAREDNFGICLLSKLPFEKSEVIYIGEAAVPSINAIVNTTNGPLAILATHPTPPVNTLYAKWRDAQLSQLPEYLPQNLPTILIGDLNATPWSYQFKKLIKKSGLIDSSKGRGIFPTWPNQKLILPIPIDHFLHSKDIFVSNKKVGPDVSSDHRPLIVDFCLINNTKITKQKE